jgi:hypothetical protein
MELQKLIHQLRHENSSIGTVAREMEQDAQYTSFKDESKLKEYMSRKMVRKGLLTGFVELLAVHELINSQAP